MNMIDIFSVEDLLRKFVIGEEVTCVGLILDFLTK